MHTKISDYLTSFEAAKFLGINIRTLYRWEEQKKIKVYRNPVNGFRLYKQEDLEELLNMIRLKE